MSVPVVAVIKSHSGKERELETVLRSLVRATHLEAGCERYALHRSSSDPRAFVFIERWTSAAALQAHLSSAHIAAAMARKEELIASIEILSLDPIVEGNPAKSSF